MAECYRCPYTIKTQRKFGVTTSCNLELTQMDVSYFCREIYKDKYNKLCPFVNSGTRFPGVDYKKYETEFLTVKEKENVNYYRIRKYFS